MQLTDVLLPLRVPERVRLLLCSGPWLARHLRVHARAANPPVSDLGTEGGEQRACEQSNPGPEKEVAVPASYPAINTDE